MESIEQAINLESNEKYGKNVTLVIDLIRHPEKDYATGNLTEKGKEEFVAKLTEEYTDPENGFDTIKAYVSPLKRGQQAMEPLSQFLEENEIETTIRTKKELASRVEEYSMETDQAMDKILHDRRLTETADIQKDVAFEPISKSEESLKNEIIIKEFFDKNFPESHLKGEDFGVGLDDLVQHFAKMSQRFLSDSKVKIISVGHSGLIEHLTKLIYLKNHPELDSSEVGVEQIGGLLDYMSGPRITIISDAEGKQTANLKFKDLDLEYEIKE